MPLRKDYSGQSCSLAKALEVVGERWTLLIVRDAFFGVRRFGDFADHLDIPRAVLSERLTSLVDAGVLERVDGDHGHVEYVLTDKGLALQPVLRSLLAWGDDYYSPKGPRRVFTHAADDGRIDRTGRCRSCGEPVPPGDTVVAPGPGLPSRPKPDRVSRTWTRPHRRLDPIPG